MPIKVILKDGLHLAKSRNNKDAFRGLVYDKGNHLKGHADLVPISADGVRIPFNPELVLGVFSVVSIATGQYFLSEINNKFKTIEKGIDDIQNFLENDKRSEILANEQTILNIYRRLRFILENDVERYSTSANLKRIKDKALRNIYFFENEIKQSANSINPKIKKEEVYDSIHKFNINLPQYFCAIRNYFNSTVLDTIVTEMDDPIYLDEVINDLNGRLEEYKKTCMLCDEKITSYIEKSKDLNKKKVLPEDLYKIVKYIPIYGTAGMAVKLLAVGFDVADTLSEQSSKSSKKKMISKKDNLWEIISDYTPAEEAIKTINTYKKIQNAPVEIVFSEDGVFIKDFE